MRNSATPTIVTGSEQDLQGTDRLRLNQVSPKDAPWDKHKATAEVVEDFYKGSRFDRYGKRMEDCSQLLDFVLQGAEDGVIGLRLQAAHFCRVRNCPVCQWRRSLRWKAKAHEVLPKVAADYPSHRWLFLTLTVKNCPVENLRETLAEMNKGWRRLTDRLGFPAIGWLKSTEVTRGKLGDAHPHLHILLLVSGGYFSRGYLSQEQWKANWKKAMKLDYDPQVNVKAIKKGTDPAVIVPELLKYCTKESDLTADRDWLITITTQLHKTKAITTGGILKEYLSKLEEEPDDLIGDEAETTGEDFGGVRFGWATNDKHYKMID